MNAAGWIEGGAQRRYHAGSTLGIEFDPDAAWDERKRARSLSSRVLSQSKGNTISLGVLMRSRPPLLTRIVCDGVGRH